MYNIVIEYYRTIKDIEAGKPCKVVESGFTPMALKEAEVCRSKMSNHSINAVTIALTRSLQWGNNESIPPGYPPFIRR